MQVSVAFRHMDTSSALQSYATRKLETILSKYITGQNVQSQIVFSVKRFWQIANFTVNVNGLTIKAAEETENMYASVDLALDRLERQLRRYKERIRAHKPSTQERLFTMNVLAPLQQRSESEAAEARAQAEADAEAEEAYDNTIRATGATARTAASANSAQPVGSPADAETPISVIKQETYSAPYLMPEEALMQLHLRDAQFFVFTHEETERINILHRRADGSYGLIDADPTLEP